MRSAFEIALLFVTFSLKAFFPLTLLGSEKKTSSSPLVTVAIREPRGVERTNVVVSSGLPFPRGTLEGGGAVTARRSSGETIASQFDALSHWDDGSIKWGLITVVVPELAARGIHEFILTNGKSDSEAPPPKITRLDNGVRVEFPHLTVETNVFGLVHSIHRENTPVAEGLCGRGRLILHGRPIELDSVHLREIQTEEHGALRTVIRSHGTVLATPESSFDFISRVTISASGHIATDYTVVHHGLNDFHGLGVKLSIAERFTSVEIGDATIPLTAATNPASPTSRVGVRQLTADSARFFGASFDNSPRQARYHGGAWLHGERERLGIALSEFWQRYPSELAFTKDEVHLWFYPVTNESPSPLHRAGRATRGEFTIVVGDAKEKRASAESLALTDLHAFASPQWYRSSGVLGNYTLDDFNLAHGTYHGHVAEHMSFLQKRKFDVNEFGFWDFGDGKGSADNAFRRNNEFGISFAMLFHYLRTGDHRFFEEGVAFAKHFRDIDTLHHGDMTGKSIRHTDHHVAGGTGYDTAHQWTEGMLLQFLLTGDRRSLEVARSVGVPLLAYVAEMTPRLKAKPHTIPMSERNLGWTLLSLMFLEEVTGDAEYSHAVKEFVDGIVASQHPKRGHWPRDLPHPDFDTGGSCFMLGVLTEALLRYHEKTGDERVAKSLVGASRWLSDEMWNPTVKNIRYKQWDRYWDSYNDGRTIPMVLPGMIYAEYLGRRDDERYRSIVDDTLKLYSRSCADLDKHGEGRNFKSMGMMSRSMPRFFYYFEKVRQPNR